MSESTKEQGKNLTIELFRILFTTVIMLHHFRMYSDALPFGGGYMATDFFFMLSGLFVYREYEHNSSLIYLKRRYVRLITLFLPLNLVLFAIIVGIFKFSYTYTLWEFIRENLMLEVFIPDSSLRFNAPMWYLGYLLIASFMVHLVLRVFCKRKHHFTCFIILGTFIFILYITIIFTHGCGNIYPQCRAIFDIKPLIRGLCGLICGCFIGFISAKVHSPSKLNAIILPFVVVLDIYILMWKTGYTRYDILIYVFIVFNIFLINNYNLYYHNTFLEKTTLLFGETSYCAYIIHFPIAHIIAAKHVFADWDWKIYSLLFIVLIWGLAIISFVTIKKMSAKRSSQSQ